MAEEIIDLRDRIEKMRIQIESEAVEQLSKNSPAEIHHRTSNSNISMSMENRGNLANQNIDMQTKTNNLNANEKIRNKISANNDSFPAVSLSVKNPVSSKVLIIMVTLQILSNLGILYFLYLGME